jgi:hypothetical protein
MDEFYRGVVERYSSLDEEQKRLVRNFINTDTGQLVAFILGPEMSGLVSELQTEAQQTEVEPEFLRG